MPQQQSTFDPVKLGAKPRFDPAAYGAKQVSGAAPVQPRHGEQAGPGPFELRELVGGGFVTRFDWGRAFEAVMKPVKPGQARDLTAHADPAGILSGASPVSLLGVLKEVPGIGKRAAHPGSP